MFDIGRLTTLHPALVHLPLGVLPLLVLAYAIGLGARKRQSWMFVGDVALGFAAVACGLAAGFGYVAYFRLGWPGGLEPWPMVHLVLGTATTLAVWLLAWLRFRALRADKHAGTEPRRSPLWLFGAASVSLLALAAGYIGGEVLVFHAGTGVRAAGDGVLAPPLSLGDAAPSSLHETMHRLRPLWANSVVGVSKAVVYGPDDATYSSLSDDATRMQKLSRWLIDWGSTPAPDQPFDDTERTDLRRIAAALEESAQQLQASAARHDLQGSVQASAAVTQRCAECHARLRDQPEANKAVNSHDGSPEHPLETSRRD